MIDIKVGDHILAKPYIVTKFRSVFEEPKLKLRRGRVVYVHPQGRYITAAFDYGGNECREAFLPGDFRKTE